MGLREPLTNWSVSKDGVCPICAEKLLAITELQKIEADTKGKEENGRTKDETIKPT
jgi:hypothetical protein